MNTAQNALFTKHINLAHYWAHRLFPTMPYEDKLQVACEALTHAAQKFDPERGVKFPSLAGTIIMQLLYKHAAREMYRVALPLQRFYELRKFQTGAEPTAGKCHTAVVNAPRIRLLEEGHTVFHAEKGYVQTESAVTVRRLLAVLPEVERVVLILRYGLFGSSALSLRQVACILKLSREGIRVIELRAVKRIQGSIKGWEAQQ